MAEVTARKILIGPIEISKYENNLFALKLIEQISKIDEEAILQQSRMAFVVNFIMGKSVFDLFLNTVLEPSVSKKFKNTKEVSLGFFSVGSVAPEHYNLMLDKLNHLPVSERAAVLMEMALNPGELREGDSIDLHSQNAVKVSAMLKAQNREQRIASLYHGSVFESLKSADVNTVNIGTVVFDEYSLKPIDSKGRPIDMEINRESIPELTAYLKSLPPEDLNIFMVRAIHAYSGKSKGLFFRKENDLPYLLSEKPVGAIGIDMDGQIQNSFIEIFKIAYNLKNNRIKDRFGASDASMLRFKDNMNAPVKDPVTSMLVRAYTHYPELLTKTLPMEINIRNVIEYIGGSDRSLGVYIGRNPFTAHRYLSKDQDRPQHVELLLEIFAQFLQEGRIQEYIEKVLIPEAKARGVEDIFGASGWPKELAE